MPTKPPNFDLNLNFNTRDPEVALTVLAAVQRKSPAADPSLGLALAHAAVLDVDKSKPGVKEAYEDRVSKLRPDSMGRIYTEGSIRAALKAAVLDCGAAASPQGAIQMLRENFCRRLGIEEPR